jgi:hypothetical protein
VSGSTCIDAVFIVVDVLYAPTDLSLSVLYINALARGYMN